MTTPLGPSDQAPAPAVQKLREQRGPGELTHWGCHRGGAQRAWFELRAYGDHLLAITAWAPGYRRTQDSKAPAISCRVVAPLATEMTKS